MSLYQPRRISSLLFPTRRGALALLGGVALTTNLPMLAHSQEFSTASLTPATSSEIDRIVQALENERATISLANDAFLAERCRATLNELQAAIATSEAGSNALRNETGDALRQAVGSSIGAIVSAVGLRLAIVAAAGVTVPVGITASAVGATVIVGGALFALSMSRGGGQGIAVTSFSSGRLSLLADVQGLAGRLGLVGATVSATLDTISAYNDAGAYDQAAARLEEAIQGLEGLRAEHTSLASDLGACREAMLADIDATLVYLSISDNVLP